SQLAELGSEQLAARDVVGHALALVVEALDADTVVFRRTVPVTVAVLAAAVLVPYLEAQVSALTAVRMFITGPAQGVIFVGPIVEASTRCSVAPSENVHARVGADEHDRVGMLLFASHRQHRQAEAAAEQHTELVLERSV